MRPGIAATAVAIIAMAALMPVASGAATVDLHRSVGYWGGYAAPKRTSPQANTYLADPYPGAAQVLNAADMARLHAMGFDGFRLTIAPGPLLDANPARRAQLLDAIGQTVQTMNSAGLSVIFDLQSYPKEVWPTESFMTGVGTPEFTRYAQLVGDVAAYLKRFDPNRIALELVNEPDKSTPGLPDMLSALYSAARKASPGLTIVVQGSCCDSLEGLLDLNAAMFNHDPNVLYSFHFYGPTIFPQQGEHGNQNCNNYGLIAYPASTGRESDALAQFEKNVEKSHPDPVDRTAYYLRRRIAIDRYYANNFGREWIDQQFDRVSQWAQGEGIPANNILVGEFGVVRFENGLGAAPDSRIRWLKDVREIAEQHHFRWSVWQYRGDMSIMNGRQATDPDPAVSAALGLR